MNYEHYEDKTAETAIANILREEAKAKKKSEKMKIERANRYKALFNTRVWRSENFERSEDE